MDRQRDAAYCVTGTRASLNEANVVGDIGRSATVTVEWRSSGVF